jgi:uncharacterized protein YidB (DUF937 family)
MGLMDTLTGLLRSSGVQDKLIKALPNVVDRMTSDGVVPSADAAKSAATSG